MLQTVALCLVARQADCIADTFCTQLGFNAVRDSYHGDERTIIMERLLTP